MEEYLRRLKNMPINPSIAAKVLETLKNQDFSFKQLEDIIGADPGLTAKILKIANSALYARQYQVTRLQLAISLLGVNTIKSLVVLLTGTGIFASKVNSAFYRQFWHHSLITAFVAKDLSVRMGRPHLADESFIAGLLHNIGQGALFLHNPERYEALVEDLIRSQGRFSAMEMDRFGITHREIGSAILERWNFPELYSDCAKEHGELNISSRWKDLIMTVSVASFLAANWTYFESNPKPWKTVEGILQRFDLGEAEMEEYQDSYRARLSTDAYYRECLELIAHTSPD